MIAFIPPKLLPPEYEEKAIIAGGFAACPQLATDCDVWVTDVPYTELVVARDRILLHANREYAGIELESALSSTDGSIDTYHFETLTLKVMRVPFRFDQIAPNRRIDIHVMVTTGTLDEVLAGFDVSTHQCAMTERSLSKNTIYKGPDWTPLDVEPRSIKWDEHTPARLEKIRTRYAHLRTEEHGIQI